MSSDPDVLRDTEDDGCPWCPYTHNALTACPEGAWSDEDGEPLADDTTIRGLAGAVADVQPRKLKVRKPRAFCNHFRCRVFRTLWRMGLLGSWLVSCYVLGWLVVLAFRALRFMLG